MIGLHKVLYSVLVLIVCMIVLGLVALVGVGLVFLLAANIDLLPYFGFVGVFAVGVFFGYLWREHRYNKSRRTIRTIIQDAPGEGDFQLETTPWREPMTREKRFTI